MKLFSYTGSGEEYGLVNENELPTKQCFETVIHMQFQKLPNLIGYLQPIIWVKNNKDEPLIMSPRRKRFGIPWYIK